MNKILKKYESKTKINIIIEFEIEITNVGGDLHGSDLLQKT